MSCSSDEEGTGDTAPSAGAGGATNVGGGPGGFTATGGSGPTPSPGPAADGWQQDYVDGSSTIGCGESADDLDGPGAARLTIGDSTIYAGRSTRGRSSSR